MRALAVLTLALWLAAPWAARADEVPANLPPSDRAAIRSVIAGQLHAFRADDAAAAFAYASPGIQALFGDAGRFMAMVRTGYQPVYRPRSADFGGLVEMEGRLAQKLRVVGPDGQPTLALYFMEHEADGTWKIDGCVLTESADEGT